MRSRIHFGAFLLLCLADVRNDAAPEESRRHILQRPARRKFSNKLPSVINVSFFPSRLHIQLKAHTLWNIYILQI